MAYPRTSLRHLMVAVAIIAILLAVFEAGRRWERAKAQPLGVRFSPNIRFDSRFTPVQ